LHNDLFIRTSLVDGTIHIEVLLIQLEVSMKYLCLLFTIALSLSFPVHSTNSNPIKNRQEIILTDLFDQLVKRQINSEMAIEKSVNALLERYPEQIDSVLKIAITKYPQEYKQIMCGALRAEPALTSDIIDIILRSNLAENADVVSIAVTEEPGYSQEIVNTAVLHDPLDIENIIRVAILTDSVMAKNVVTDTMQSYPEKILDILTVAIIALPDQVVNIVRDALRISPDNMEVVSIAINSSSSDKAREIVAAAIKSGISIESATAAAIAGGAKQTDIVKVNQ